MQRRGGELPASAPILNTFGSAPIVHRQNSAMSRAYFCHARVIFCLSFQSRTAKPVVAV
jgi:hypothetical protein